MYNYSFARTGVDAAYLAFEVPLEKVEEGVNALKTLQVGGFNVTMPDKTAVAGLVDDLSPAAKLIGACNTVTVGEDGKLTGHNTDGIGFVRNLHEHGVEVQGKKLVVLGAGGAATAICVQAALDGAAEIAIFNRGEGSFFANGQRTVQKLTETVPGCKASITPLEDSAALAAAVKNCDILVNATKVGMKPLDGETLIDPALFRADLVVADTVYNPRETRMIQEAKAAGCKTAVGGIGMLLWQGVAAYKLFTGEDMPAQEVLEKFFS
jgi:shikimate dehydrogenase